MAWTALALVALLAGVLGTLARRRGTAAPTADWVVEPVRLLAPVEQELYVRLRAAFPHHVVLTQVSLARLLRLRRSGGSMRVFQSYLRMAVPFVVCSKEFMPLIVVDVHATKDVPRPSREQQKRAAIVSASGLVYLAVAATAGVLPSADDLRQRVRTALQAKAPRPADRPAHVTAAGTAAGPVASVRRLVRPLLARAPARPPHAKVA